MTIEAGASCLRNQFSSSPPINPPKPGRIDPSPFDPPRRGAACSIRPASRENGSDCSQIRPGPCNTAKKRPSPPNSAVLILPACCTSNWTDCSNATTQPVSICSTSPGCKTRSTIVPPACMNTMPVPSSFCMMKPSPPNKPVMILR